ncbi:MAG: energy transducer TonB [Burkholderiales bacterium]
MAVVVHVVLFVFLFFTVRWQTKPPSPIMAELWTQAPSVPAQPPPPPTPKPEPLPTPPKPEPKPAPPPPPVEKPAPPKPDIAVEQEKQKKQKEEREKLEREKKLDQDRKERDRKEKDRKDFERAERERMDKELTRELDRDQEKTVKDQLARESEAARREKEMRDLLAKQAVSAGDNRARVTWIDKIRAKIRGNVLVPDGINGNPEALFDVVQLPTGEVVSVRLRKSSGVKAYDESVERAILKSSPLPRPDNPELFERELRLTFRPLE